MTVSEIIADALTDLSVLAAGEVVTAADEATCLRAFQNMVKALPGFGMGGGLTDVLVKVSPHIAEPNERLIYTGVGTMAVTFPTVTYDDKPLRNGDRIVVTSGTNEGAYIYIINKAAWLNLDTITGASVDPIGSDCNKALTDMLAFRVAKRFGVPVSQDIGAANDIGERLIAARFAPDMTADLDPALWSYWGDIPVQQS